ncbi:type I-E CRISPR-associated protein Cse2/CasB [Methylosinus sp. LW4]|uniref:type I-E CRISPR-associated protein Cse2/CasB n=1 Tax=Methylosinus sp. LW4 TaxID=136993 RepID=UPI00035CC39D|nr:type I-E CRISPR-associated protein Cse2/CasB [Methylosinus sp. LW4]
MSKKAAQTNALDYGFISFQWWKTLDGRHPDKREGGKDRVARARLRRASPAEAMYEEATLQLFHALGASKARLPRVATLACVLATIRDDERLRFGRSVGRENFSDEQSAKLSLLRFKRLLEATEEEEIAASFRRAIAIAGFAASVRDIARLVLFFDEDKTRRDLVFDYYGAGERPATTAEAGSLEARS